MTVMRTEQLANKLLLRLQDLHGDGWSFFVTLKRWISLLFITFFSLCSIPDEGHNIRGVRLLGIFKVTGLFSTRREGFAGDCGL